MWTGSTRPNASEPWLRAWERPWRVGMCGYGFSIRTGSIQPGGGAAYSNRARWGRSFSCRGSAARGSSAAGTRHPPGRIRSRASWRGARRSRGRAHTTHGNVRKASVCIDTRPVCVGTRLYVSETRLYVSETRPYASETRLYASIRIRTRPNRGSGEG